MQSIIFEVSSSEKVFLDGELKTSTNDGTINWKFLFGDSCSFFIAFWSFSSFFQRGWKRRWVRECSGFNLWTKYVLNGSFLAMCIFQKLVSTSIALSILIQVLCFDLKFDPCIVVLICHYFTNFVVSVIWVAPIYWKLNKDYVQFNHENFDFSVDDHAWAYPFAFVISNHNNSIPNFTVNIRGGFSLLDYGRFEINSSNYEFYMLEGDKQYA